MRLGRPLWWMEGPLLEVRIDSSFSGRIVAVTRGLPKENVCRSYDHRGQGYGWVPDHPGLDWAIDVECRQGRSISPKFSEQGEMAFLCGWTRCEVVAKITRYPVLLAWKGLKDILSYEPGYQLVSIGEQRFETNTFINRDLVFSLAHMGRPQ